MLFAYADPFLRKENRPRIVDLNGSNNDQKQPRRQNQPDKRKHDVKYPFDITKVTLRYFLRRFLRREGSLHAQPANGLSHYNTL